MLKEAEEVEEKDEEVQVKDPGPRKKAKTKIGNKYKKKSKKKVASKTDEDGNEVRGVTKSYVYKKIYIAAFPLRFIMIRYFL